MNEKGLVNNVLYLAESKYPTQDDGRPSLLVGFWAQYALDNYANVSDLVDDFKDDKWRIISPTLPGGAEGNCHLAVNDASGDSAIFEYLDGKLVVHHSRKYNVMTNSPPFSDQLVLKKYWDGIGTEHMVPGTFRAADRFIRLSSLLDALPTNSTLPYRQMQAGALSAIRAVSAPYGIVLHGAGVSRLYWRQSDR